MYVMSKGALSTTRLNQMHDVMACYVERGAVPGLVTLVSRRGQTEVDVIGKRAIDGESMTRDTIFRISSMTKPITAVATMILVEECKLRLDDPVDQLLPELANRQVLKALNGPLDDTVPANRPVTVRDLLTFTLGFGLVLADPRDYPVAAAAKERGVILLPPSSMNHLGPDEWMAQFGTMPLMHQPGEQWMYGSGSKLLGVLIPRATGQSFASFLQERIFDPLGMKDTGFVVPTGKLDRLSTAYWTNAADGSLIFADGPANSECSQSPPFEDGAAGLVSTIDDYHAFGQMMLGKGALGNERILSRPSVELMMSDQLTPAQQAASVMGFGVFDREGWGFGGSVVTRRDQIAHSIGTYGWFGGFGTAWYADPKEEMTTILMTQASIASPQARALSLDFSTSAYQSIDD
jgi:CubicO group peptidase (beta-lactamase class C family)